MWLWMLPNTVWRHFGCCRILADVIVDAVEYFVMSLWMQNIDLVVSLWTLQNIWWCDCGCCRLLTWWYHCGCCRRWLWMFQNTGLVMSLRMLQNTDLVMWLWMLQNTYLVMSLWMLQNTDLVMSVRMLQYTGLVMLLRSVADRSPGDTIVDIPQNITWRYHCGRCRMSLCMLQNSHRTASFECCRLFTNADSRELGQETGQQWIDHVVSDVYSACIGDNQASIG